MCLDTEELARTSAIYTSLADSMVASVIEELSQKDQRSKLLLEKLTINQEAQVSAVSAGFAAASNLQLLRRDALLRNFGFQPGFEHCENGSIPRISRPGPRPQRATDTEELARTSAIYTSLADSMVASVIEELSLCQNLDDQHRLA